MTMTDHQKSSWKQAVAGSIAGLSTVAMLQPLDVVKTRLQVQDGLGSLPRYGSTMHAFRVILQNEGWRALYSGLMPSIIGSTVAWGSYFWAYDIAKRTVRQRTGQQQLGAVSHLTCAAAAGTFVSILTNPIWVVKTRLQVQSRRQSIGIKNDFHGSNGRPAIVPYAGFLDCLVQISRKEGIRGLYKGLLPSLFLVSHGAIQFMAYEDLKQRIPAVRSVLTSVLSPHQHRHQVPLPTASSFDIAACGALSKLIATLATYPSQVLRSRLQQRMDIRALRYAGVIDTFRQTLSREGIRGCYKGLLPHVLRVMPQSAITFLMYETVLQFMH